MRKALFKYAVLLALMILIAFFIRGIFQNRSTFDGEIIHREPENKVLSLAFVADIHLDWDNLKKAVTMINGMNLDGVIFLGDLTDLGSIEDLNKSKGILDNLNIKYYVIPGNHDIWYSRHEGRQSNYYFDQVFPEINNCVVINGYNLIFLDNSNEQKQISDNVWDNLRRCIMQSQPLLLFSHIPLYHPANERIMGQYFVPLATQSGILMEQMCQKKTRLISSAHHHAFSKYYFECNSGYKIPMIVAPSISSSRNFQTARFLVVDILSNGEINEREVELQKGYN